MWRLAPRQELERTTNRNEIRAGHAIQFSFGIEGIRVTACVLRIASRNLNFRVKCGSEGGTIEDFEKNEMSDCVELFAASDLQDLFSQTKKETWEVAMKTKSKEMAEYRPKLNNDFTVFES